MVAERGLLLVGGGRSTPTDTSIATLWLKKAAVKGWFCATNLKNKRKVEKDHKRKRDRQNE